MNRSRTYEEAAVCPNQLAWNSAMKEELIYIRHKYVWSLAALPTESKKIAAKWLDLINNRSNGSVER